MSRPMPDVRENPRVWPNRVGLLTIGRGRWIDHLASERRLSVRSIPQACSVGLFRGSVLREP